MNETRSLIEDNKYVELKYKVIDSTTGNILTEVEYPLGYVHGVNEILAPTVMAELEGKAAGDIIEVPIDCNKLYGPRNESLVVTDYLDNVPEEYREIGTAILMENQKGQTKSFLVTRIDGSMITIDGNNPLCGREVIFKLEILVVRDATEDEIEAGGKVENEPDVGDGVKIPLQ
ncbi:MAG: FKBP-type peptidyl-prolyl cis-trans isomerase [marine bacterium B5-7]|nr:MAG: FKBP-type peptidyl-prolyl cis-trans isomerase [marine bacterium B5-7]